MKQRCIPLRLLLSAAFLAMVLVPPALALSPPLGKVVALTGKVTVTRDGETWNLSAGDPLYSGDVVEAARNSTAELSIGTGHHVKLQSGTKITVTPQETSFNVQTFYGGVLAAVVKAQPDAAGFRVSSPTASAAVRGTLFCALVAEDGSTEFLVHSGEVQAADATGENTVTVGELSKTVVPVGGAPSAAEALTAEETAMLEGWAGSLLTLAGIAAAGAGMADSALATLSGEAVSSSATVTSAGSGMPWILLGALGAVAATAAIVYFTDDTPAADDSSYIDIEINW